MNIKLKYYGFNKNSLPDEIELPNGSKVKDLLLIINDKLECLLEFTVMVNKSEADDETLLNDKDEVYILYVICGG